MAAAVGCTASIKLIDYALGRVPLALQCSSGLHKPPRPFPKLFRIFECLQAQIAQALVVRL